MNFHRYVLVLLAFGCATTFAFAAEPALRTLDIRGLTIGGTTTLTIDGDDLGKTPRLHLPFQAKQTLKPGSTDKKATFDVSLAADVEAGYHHLRLVTDEGISLPVIIAVDRITQLSITEPIKTLPIALHGTVAGPNMVEAKFQGKAKQRVMIEVESQRLGGKLRPVLHLYNAKKLQIDWAWGTPAQFGDTRLEAVLPEDGVYTVTLHDAEYAAPAPSFFRMRIGEWSYIDQVYPSAIGKDQPWTVGFPGISAPMQMTVQAPKDAAWLALPWPKPGAQNWSGMRPFVIVSPYAEQMEKPKSDKPQTIPDGPAGVNGKLETPNEEDRYLIPVQSGTKVRLEVFAERIGTQIDAALVVRTVEGTPAARAEDSPGTLDPVLEYNVPAKVSSIIVGVVDAQGRGGPRGVYRLVIEPQGSVKDAFKLSTPLQRLSLAKDGRGIVPIFADRKGGYAGAIDIVADPPTRGLSMKDATIPPGADGALVTFERLDSLTDPIIMNLRGRSDKGATQTVIVKGHPLERLQPWLATEFTLATTSQPANEFTLDWRDLPNDAALVPASRLQLPVKLTRPMSKSTVKLTLLTSQITPILNNQPDPNKALRQDKLGELAANVNSGDVTVLVPPELSSPVYDVTVQAELLDAAKKLLATAYAPVRRMQVNLPITLQLAGPNRIEVPFDAKKGATLKLEGKLERRAGLKADVAIAITGLPAGAKADAVTVKVDATDFAVNVTFPPTVAPGEFSGVKLSASFAPDGKQPNVRVKSRDVELTLVLKSAGK